MIKDSYKYLSKYISIGYKLIVQQKIREYDQQSLAYLLKSPEYPAKPGNKLGMTPSIIIK